MNGRFFVDTNLLVYAYDESAGEKRTRAVGLVGEILKSGIAVTSTQVLQELVICLRRKVLRPLDTREIAKIVVELVREWHVVVNNPESVLRSLEIADRYKTSFWDALILHAALASEADTLYSEDLSHGQLYGGVRVLNPFKL